jgi:hypothetical protein
VMPLAGSLPVHESITEYRTTPSHQNGGSAIRTSRLTFEDKPASDDGENESKTGVMNGRLALKNNLS